VEISKYKTANNSLSNNLQSSGVRQTKINPKKVISTWTSVAHTCNLSYSGDRDSEDCGSKPAWANSSMKPYLEKPITKKGWWGG
jgi:transcription initiation factor TFIID subunit TAF12